MSYKRLSLTNGDILSESHLMHIEDGVDSIINESVKFKEKMATILSSKGITAHKDETLDQIAYKINQLGAAILHNDEVEEELIDIRETCPSGFIQMVYTDERNANASFAVWTKDKGSFIVDWGDGSSNTYVNGATANHTYQVGRGAPFKGSNTQFVVTIRAIGGNVIERFKVFGDQQMQWFVSKDVYFTNIDTMFSQHNNTNGYAPLNLKYVDIIGGSLASKETTATGTFRDCRSLERVTGVIDLSTATNTHSFFCNCQKLTQIPSVLNLSSSTDVNSFFSDCHSLQQVPASLDIRRAKNCTNMYSGCLKLKAVPEIIDLSAATNISNMFYNCKSLTKVPELKNAHNVELAPYLFNECVKLEQVYPILNLPSCTNFNFMFKGCVSLVDAPSTIIMTSATTANELFRDCTKLENVPRIINAPVLKTGERLFYDCTALRVAPTTLSFDFATSLLQMFYGCTSLVTPPTVIDMPSVLSATEIFSRCRALEVCKTEINAPVATNIAYLFNECISLREVADEYSFPKATSANSLFNNCQMLQRPPRLNLPKAENLSSMFYNCYNLESSLPYSFPKARNISDFYRGCRMLSVVESLDAPECENMTRIYSETKSLSSVATIGGPYVQGIDGAFQNSILTNLISIPNRIDLSSCTGSNWNLYGNNLPLTSDCITFVGLRSGINFYGFPNVKAIRIENQSNLCLDLNFSKCGMDANAINQLFGDLQRTNVARTINVSGNPGASTCDASIATAKGWKVTK